MLSAGERRLLHGEVGAALERLWDEQTDEIAAQLARHHFQAGHREKAVAFSLRAAHRARLGYADAEARAFYQQAVAIAARESIAKDMIASTEGEFNEAPMLAHLVASGELPSVEQRLPLKDDVKVVLPLDGIGQYGGTWRNVTWSSLLESIRTILYDPPLRWKADYTGYEPGLLKSWEVSGDGTRITWRFRKGVRWSDGVPFTTADLRFWWKDMATNPDVDCCDVPRWGRKADGTSMDVFFPDEVTLVMAWDAPQYTTVFDIAQGYWPWERMMKPRHFLDWPGWIVNQDFNDRSVGNWEEICDLLRDKRFRRALSHAMDRQRIIDLVWDGVGTPQQGTISPQSWHFASPEGKRVYKEWANAYIEHDPDLAKRLLDQAGMLDADGDGWRELPSGASFRLCFYVTDWDGRCASVYLEATESFAADLRARASHSYPTKSFPTREEIDEPATASRSAPGTCG